MKKKVLVIYYSLTGNTKFIAGIIQKATMADLLEIKPVKEIDSQKVSRYFWGGIQATMSSKPELEPINLDITIYDLIFVGSPVWVWNITPPMRSFLDTQDLSGKQVAIWLCSARKSKDTFKKFKELMNDVEIVGQMNYVEPLKGDTESIKREVNNWAKSKL